MQVNLHNRLAIIAATVLSSFPSFAFSQPCNLADVAAVGGTVEEPGVPDLQLTVDDIIVFTGAFSDAGGCPGDAPCNLADVAGVGGPPEPRDGQLTVDDLLAFVDAFSAGCPNVIVGDDAPRLIFETELEEVYAQTTSAFALEESGNALIVTNTDGRSSATLASTIVGSPHYFAHEASPWPDGVSADWSWVAYTLVGENGIYFVAGQRIQLTKSGEVPLTVYVPVRLFASSAEASLFAAGSGPVSNPIDVINDTYNNAPPRPAGSPPRPGNPHYVPGTTRPVCPTSLPCADLCDCLFRQELWDAQIALHSSWSSCNHIFNAAILGCAPISGLVWWGGPIGVSVAYSACIGAAVTAEISCKNTARAAYAAAYQVAIGNYEQCVANCGGGGGVVTP